MRIDKATRAAYLEDCPKNSQGTPLLQGPRDWEAFKHEVDRTNKRWRKEHPVQEVEKPPHYPAWIRTYEEQVGWLEEINEER